MVTQTADLDSGRRGNLESVIEKRYGTVEVSLEEMKKRGGVRAWGYELRRSSAATAPPCFRRYAMGMGLLVDQRTAESLPS
jgi:hypothetical protein